MSAASRARKVDSRLEIVVLEKGRDISYGACGLPYYISGQVKNEDDLVTYTPEFFREKRNIEIRLEHEAVEIDPGRKQVHALHRGSQPVNIHYDKLVLATGGAPAFPEGMAPDNLSNVFTCNNLVDAIRLREFLEQSRPRNAVVVGASYIGLECAEALAARGLGVSIVERSRGLLGGIETELSACVLKRLSESGVSVHMDSTATGLTPGPSGRAVAVQFGVGDSLPADVILLATGIRPRTGLAEAAGICLGATGAIAVDDRMQTSVNSIYAAGDCAEAMHLVSGKPAYLPLGTTANKQGRVAGENAAGGNARFEGIVGTLATKVFGLEIARTGLSTEQAHKAGFAAETAVVESHSKAKYLGGGPLLAALIWDVASGRMLGFQMVGEEGVAKRIDAAAVALHARMRVEDLLHLDLSYAPPFATVWEPLLIAANEVRKKTRRR